MMLCFHCAGDHFPVISSSLISEGLVDAYKPVFCFQPQSCAWGGHSLAQNLCLGSAAIPRSAANCPSIFRQIPFPLWGSCLRQHIQLAAMGAKVLKLPKRRAKGERSAFSLTQLKPLSSQWHLKVWRPAKR